MTPLPRPLRAAALLAVLLPATLAAQEIQIVPLEDLTDEPGLTLEQLQDDGITLETLPEDGFSFEPNQALADEAFQTFEQQIEVTTGAVGTVRVLDKMTGRVQDLALPAGETGSVGRIDVTMGECRYPTETPTSDAFVYLTITERPAGTAAADRETLFEGWMIASSPALMALDHPRYDVWALRCGAAPDEALPELTEAEAAAEEVAQETARPGDHAPETSLRPRPRP